MFRSLNGIGTLGNVRSLNGLNPVQESVKTFLVEGKAIDIAHNDLTGENTIAVSMKSGGTAEKTTINDTDIILVADTTGILVGYCTIADFKTKGTLWSLSTNELYPDSTDYNLLIGTTTNALGHKLLCTGDAKITGSLALGSLSNVETTINNLLTKYLYSSLTGDISGKLLIGKNDGALALANITGGTGIGIANGNGTIEVNDAGTAGTVAAIQTLYLMDDIEANTSGGKLLITKTDGTLALATLTAGTNITITNTSGAIELINGITNNNQITNGSSYLIADSALLNGVQFVANGGIMTYGLTKATQAGYIDFMEGTDNGVHKCTLKTDASIPASYEVLLPAEAGTIALTTDSQFLWSAAVSGGIRPLLYTKRVLIGKATYYTPDNGEILQVVGNTIIVGNMEITGGTTTSESWSSMGILYLFNTCLAHDNKKIIFGTDEDYSIEYDEATTDNLVLASKSATDFNFNWRSDGGDTNASKYSWYIPAAGTFCSLNSFVSGAWASPFAVYPNSGGDTTLDNVWIKNLIVSTNATTDPWGAIGLMSDMTTPIYATMLNKLAVQGYWSNRGYLNECDDVSATYRATMENRTVYDEASEFFMSSNGMPRWDISCRESTGSYELRFYSNETSSGTGSWRPTFAGASTLAFGISVDGICTADRYFVPFTGSHDCKINDTINYEKGLIIDVIDSDVRVNGHYPDGDVCNNNFTCKLCDTPNSKSVLGVINQKTHPKSKTPQKKDNEPLPAGTFMFNWSVNAVGEGSILITNFNGEIEKGDLIVSSVIAGYGMCQKTARGKDDLIRSKTVAKCMKVIDWANITDTIIHNGNTYKKLLCPCIYMCG